MADDSNPAQPPDPEWVEFLVDGIRGLYVPFVGGIMRLIPNTPAAIASAQKSLRWSRASWLN
jgi:hypothetical protein